MKKRCQRFAKKAKLKLHPEPKIVKKRIKKRKRRKCSNHFDTTKNLH